MPLVRDAPRRLSSAFPSLPLFRYIYIERRAELLTAEAWIYFPQKCECFLQHHSQMAKLLPDGRRINFFHLTPK